MPDSKWKNIVPDFVDFMASSGDEDLVSPDMLKYLALNHFFTAPASTKYHGNYEHGLFEHSFAVAKFLVQLTEDNHLIWKNPRSPYIVGMFHDLCKIDQYRVISHPQDPDIRYDYNPDTLLKGHGDKSVMLLSQFYTLTDEEIMCIRYHMGAFTDKSEWNDYTRAVSQYPNVLWTHHADMLASHVAGV